jgi:DNA-binding NarL/FixJ family response regulator
MLLPMDLEVINVGILEECKMRVLLADDQDKVRSALRLVIDQEPDLEIIGEVTDPEQLLLKIEEWKPDLLLLDWDLIPAQRKSLFTTLKNHYPHLYVIAMSTCILSEYEAIAAGANAFVSKVEPVEKFILSLQNLVHFKDIDI